MYKQILCHSTVEYLNSVVNFVIFSYFSEESAYFRGVQSCDQVDQVYHSLLYLSATLNLLQFVMCWVIFFLTVHYFQVSFKLYMYQT